MCVNRLASLNFSFISGIQICLVDVSMVLQSYSFNLFVNPHQILSCWMVFLWFWVVVRWFAMFLVALNCLPSSDVRITFLLFHMIAHGFFYVFTTCWVALYHLNSPMPWRLGNVLGEAWGNLAKAAVGGSKNEPPKMIGMTVPAKLIYLSSPNWCSKK